MTVITAISAPTGLASRRRLAAPVRADAGTSTVASEVGRIRSGPVILLAAA